MDLPAPSLNACETCEGSGWQGSYALCPACDGRAFDIPDADAQCLFPAGSKEKVAYLCARYAEGFQLFRDDDLSDREHEVFAKPAPSTREAVDDVADDSPLECDSGPVAASGPADVRLPIIDSQFQVLAVEFPESDSNQQFRYFVWDDRHHQRVIFQRSAARAFVSFYRMLRKQLVSPRESVTVWVSRNQFGDTEHAVSRTGEWWFGPDVPNPSHEPKYQYGPKSSPKDKHARYRHRMMAAGLCQRCGQPAAEGSTSCAYHRDYKAEKRRQKREEIRIVFPLSDDNAVEIAIRKPCTLNEFAKIKMLLALAEGSFVAREESESTVTMVG